MDKPQALLPEQLDAVLSAKTTRPAQAEIVRRALGALDSAQNVVVTLPEGLEEIVISQVVLVEMKRSKGAVPKTLLILPSEAAVDHYLRGSGWLNEHVRMELVDRASQKSHHEMKRLLASCDLLVITAAQLAETLGAAVLRFSQLDEFELWIVEDYLEVELTERYFSDLALSISSLAKNKAPFLFITPAGSGGGVRGRWPEVDAPLTIRAKGKPGRRPQAADQTVRQKAARRQPPWLRSQEEGHQQRPSRLYSLTGLERLFWIGLVVCLLILDIRLFPIEIILDNLSFLTRSIAPALIGLVLTLFVLKLLFSVITWRPDIWAALTPILEKDLLPLLAAWDIDIRERGLDASLETLPGMLGEGLSAAVKTQRLKREWFTRRWNEDFEPEAEEEEEIYAEGGEDENEAQEEERTKLVLPLRPLKQPRARAPLQPWQGREPAMWPKGKAFPPPVPVEPPARNPGGPSAPLKEFFWKVFYTSTMSTFDESFSIDTSDGEFLGECGVGISETVVGSGVIAFEAWLFDKSDIQTVTNVILSPGMSTDRALQARLSAKGEVVAAEPGLKLELRTSTIVLTVSLAAVELASARQVFKTAVFELIAARPGEPPETRPAQPARTEPEEPEAGEVAEVGQDVDAAGFVPVQKQTPSEGQDEFYQAAVSLAGETAKISVSILQRRLRIDYQRAQRLFEALIAGNIVDEDGLSLVK